MPSNQHGVIIVGSGLAALACAARLTEKEVKNISLYATGLGGTPYIAAINFVLPDNPYGDLPEEYCEDMLHAGYNLGDPCLVREMCDNTVNGYALLRRCGVQFARKQDGSTLLRHVSGHTHPRSLCCTEELIGVRIVRTLTEWLKEKGVQFFDGHECLKLLKQDGRTCGITVRDPSGALSNVYAPAVVAAWGGIGHLLGASTYPDDIKGNTLAIAHEAGAELIDIEFLEYEPMVVLDPPGAVGEPCPTAMLGEGAYLLNSEGERFLLKVRPVGEGGAPKTLINREIWKQVKAGKGSPHGGCWVDLRHIDRNILKAYPWFFDRLMENGADPNKQLIEVGPMPHSFSGGIKVDAGYQSTLPGFYAVGEACGGVHGACRCAGNAASQATLSGLLCAEAIAKAERTSVKDELPVEYVADESVYKRFVPGAREIAANALGIYRAGQTLLDAEMALLDILNDPLLRKDDCTYQTILSMRLMVSAALMRKESRGAHMRLDYPDADKKYERTAKRCEACEG